MKILNKFFLNCVLIFTVIVFIQKISSATDYSINIPLVGSQEVPPNASTALGALSGTYNDVTRQLSFNLTFNGLLSPTTAAHFHAPAPMGVIAPVVIGFTGFPVGVVSGTYSNTYILTAAQNTEILAGLWYVNIHTAVHPGGEIRGQLQEGTSFTFETMLEGSQEVPPNPSTGLGMITGTYDALSHTLSFNLSFTGLLSPTTAAHFHGPAMHGVNAPIQIGFAGFPVGVSSGVYSNIYLLDSAQEAQFLAGLWYVNIHTSASPGGEIRAQLVEGTLPVELSSFTSNVMSNNVTLKWSTTNEINNDGFEVERKLSSSLEWVKVGDVSANGNSIELNNYTFSERINTGVYNYRLKQIDFNGNFEYFNLSNEVIVGLPASFKMSQNYPNPFNPSTKIDFELPYDGNVKIVLFDISGKEIATLVNEIKLAGYNSVTYNAFGLPSGIYIYRIETQGFNESKRMMLVK